MYGLIIEAFCDTLRARYGEQTISEILKKAGIQQSTFLSGKIYSESLIGRITKSTFEVTGTPIQEIVTLCGESFVPYVEQHGYGRILRVLGRNMRDFLNGLDNLHEYIKFTYPKLKPPSFFCEAESKTGLTLHYRSRRKGFLNYVMGQIRSVGLRYYDLVVDIDVVLKEETLDLVHVVMRLHFDNRAFERNDLNPDQVSAEKLSDLQLSSDIFFEVFPFHIVFSRTLLVTNAGSGLLAVMPHITGQSVDEVFTLVRPLVEFSISNVSPFPIISGSKCEEIFSVLTELNVLFVIEVKP